MTACNVSLKCLALLMPMALLAPLALGQERLAPCAREPWSARLTLSAKPVSFPANTTTTVQFRLTASGSGSAGLRATVGAVRLIRELGGQKTIIPMTAMGSGQPQVFVAQAAFVAPAPAVFNVIAQAEQQAGTGEFLVKCLARSNTLRLVATAPPPPPAPVPVPVPVPVPPPILETVSGKGISLRYPPGWQVNEAVIAEGGPLALNNFNSRYLTGGVPPKGGAEVDITVTQTRQSAQQALAQDLSGVEFLNSRQVKVGGSAGTQVWYHDQFESGLVTTNTAVYVPREGRMYKFFLTYHAKDPNEKSLTIQFKHMLDSVQFKDTK